MPSPNNTALFAKTALLPEGWRDDVAVEIAKCGKILSVECNTAPRGKQVGILLPSPGNLHSHSFQRAMAGMTEKKSSSSQDSFWTWRKTMFSFLEVLTPDDVEAIAAFVQMEMLEAGYASVGEFHYLHHQADGTPYDDIGELSARIMAAANETGIGLTHLPVLYQYGGCDRRPLAPGQVRFGNDMDRFTKVYQRSENLIRALAHDSRLGLAPHSLRAIDDLGLKDAVTLAGSSPLHMHVAEQQPEVEEVLATKGARPISWLLENHAVGPSWCLIHCTQMTPEETGALARTGAVAGLCPITESSLGDGIFDGVRYLNAQGAFGVGSDSNIRISLTEELRTLEYSQRLRDRNRAALSTPDKSTGRVLFEGAVVGGAQALGRTAGQIAPGYFADLVTLDGTALELEGREKDEILDALIFAGDDGLVQDVWSAGRHVVQDGFHVKGNSIRAAYRKTMASIRDRI